MAKKYDFLQDESNSITKIEVGGLQPKLKAPEKNSTKYINMPFVMQDGGFPQLKVDVLKLDYKYNGKRRFENIKADCVPKDLLDEFLEEGAEIWQRYTTVVLEMTGRFDKNKKIYKATDCIPITMVLTKDTIKQFKTIVGMYDLKAVDIAITSSNPAYNAMTLQASVGANGTNAFAGIGYDDEEVEAILDECAELFKDGWKSVCEEYSEKELRRKLEAFKGRDEDDGEDDDEFSDDKPSKSKRELDEDDDDAPRARRIKRKVEDDEYEGEDVDETLNKKVFKNRSKDEDDEEEAPKPRRKPAVVEDDDGEELDEDDDEELDRSRLRRR